MRRIAEGQRLDPDGHRVDGLAPFQSEKRLSVKETLLDAETLGSWIYECLIITKLGKCLLRVHLGDPPNIKKLRIHSLCSLLATMQKFSNGCAQTYAKLQKRGVVMAEGSYCIVAIVCQEDREIPSVKMKAAQILFVFERQFGALLEKLCATELDDAELRAHTYTVADELHEAVSIPDQETLEPFLPFENSYVRHVVASPPYEESWLGPLVRLPGVIRTVLVNPVDGTVFLDKQSEFEDGERPMRRLAQKGLPTVWDTALRHASSLLHPEVGVSQAPQLSNKGSSSKFALVLFSPEAARLAICIRLVHMHVPAALIVFCHNDKRREFSPISTAAEESRFKAEMGEGDSEAAARAALLANVKTYSASTEDSRISIILRRALNNIANSIGSVFGRPNESSPEMLARHGSETASSWATGGAGAVAGPYTTFTGDQDGASAAPSSSIPDLDLDSQPSPALPIRRPPTEIAPPGGPKPAFVRKPRGATPVTALPSTHTHSPDPPPQHTPSQLQPSPDVATSSATHGRSDGPSTTSRDVAGPAALAAQHGTHSTRVDTFGITSDVLGPVVVPAPPLLPRTTRPAPRVLPLQNKDSVGRTPADADDPGSEHEPPPPARAPTLYNVGAPESASTASDAVCALQGPHLPDTPVLSLEHERWPGDAPGVGSATAEHQLNGDVLRNAELLPEHPHPTPPHFDLAVFPASQTALDNRIGDNGLNGGAEQEQSVQSCEEELPFAEYARHRNLGTGKVALRDSAAVVLQSFTGSECESATRPQHKQKTGKGKVVPLQVAA